LIFHITLNTLPSTAQFNHENSLHNKLIEDLLVMTTEWQAIHETKTAYLIWDSKRSGDI